MAKEKLNVHAVVSPEAAAHSFWPRSRTRTPKQLLNIVGKDTMLQQTIARLRPLIRPDRIWTVTNAECRQPRCANKFLVAARKRVLTEPVGRNTAAAIGLAAIHVPRGGWRSLMAVLPADHYIELDKNTGRS